MSIETRFDAALESLVATIRQDRTILAAILCGSLSHDTVWQRSDIDLALITVDDKDPGRPSSVALASNGVNVHAFLMTRAEFRRAVEGALHNSFFHSLLAKGRLLYTHDETIAALCAHLQQVGERDTRIQLLNAAGCAIRFLDKAGKWFATRGDLDYTSLWILYAATAFARIEVLSARQLAGREVILQALEINPEFFDCVYTRILNTRKTAKNVRQALDAMEDYLARRARTVCAPVLEYLAEAGEARSASEIENHFQRNFGVEGVTTVCEYLADRGLTGKASIPTRLTRRSNVQVEELAFVHIET